MTKISANMVEHLLYWSSIQNGTMRNVDGELPNIADRIRAGALVLTLLSVMNNDQTIDEEQYISAACDSLEGKWPGPTSETRKSWNFIREMLADG